MKEVSKPVGSVYKVLDFLLDFVRCLAGAVSWLARLLADEGLLVAAGPCHLAQLFAEAALGDHHLGSP